MGAMSKMAVNCDLESSYGIIKYPKLKGKLANNETVWVPLYLTDKYEVNNKGDVRRVYGGDKRDPC